MGYGSTQIPSFLRGIVVERSRRACHYCGLSTDSYIEGPDGNTWQIDHVVPRTAGGLTVLSNLTLSCATCNSRKGIHPVEAIPPKREVIERVWPTDVLLPKHYGYAFRWALSVAHRMSAAGARALWRGDIMRHSPVCGPDATIQLHQFLHVRLASQFESTVCYYPDCVKLGAPWEWRERFARFQRETWLRAQMRGEQLPDGLMLREVAA